LELTGKRAIVTGGSRGIGKAIARELALEGVDVGIAARDQARIDGAVEELGTKIILPPFLESRRAEIEARLTPLPDPRARSAS